MIYLDSAATTLHKPGTVPRAVVRGMRRFASPGRGGYRAAMEAAEVLYTCRTLAADLFDVSDPERVVFTNSATMGLNIAIRSLLRPGMTVLLSGYEHNAVTRCVRTISGVRILIAEGALFQPEQMLDAFHRYLHLADAVVCSQVSNVFGYCLPIEEIAVQCRTRQVPLIVDASQAAGCLPVRAETWGAAYVAMPGHKGLYGPQGTGILLCGADSKPEPLLVGGTGSQSLEQSMPEILPDLLEAGTANVPGIAGLLEGMRFVRRMGADRILAHERRLIRRLSDLLRGRQELELFCGDDPALQTGVMSFRAKGRDCEEIGTRLGKAGIAVRAGLHCAPLAHSSAGTLETGTVRLSVSAFNTLEEIERAARVIRDLI